VNATGTPTAQQSAVRTIADIDPSLVVRAGRGARRHCSTALRRLVPGPAVNGRPRRSRSS